VNGVIANISNSFPKVGLDSVTNNAKGINRTKIIWKMTNDLMFLSLKNTSIILSEKCNHFSTTNHSIDIAA